MGRVARTAFRPGARHAGLGGREGRACLARQLGPRLLCLGWSGYSPIEITCLGGVSGADGMYVRSPRCGSIALCSTQINLSTDHLPGHEPAQGRLRAKTGKDGQGQARTPCTFEPRQMGSAGLPRDRQGRLPSAKTNRRRRAPGSTLAAAVAAAAGDPKRWTPKPVACE